MDEIDAGVEEQAPSAKGEPSFVVLAAAMVACCAIPMFAIVVLVGVVGVAFGVAVGVALGLVAAAVCVAVMIQHRRRRAHRPGDDRPHA